MYQKLLVTLASTIAPLDVGKGSWNPMAVFPCKGHLSPEKEELDRLRKENKRLRMERDILKKATAFFAKESQ